MTFNKEINDTPVTQKTIVAAIEKSKYKETVIPKIVHIKL